MVSVTVVADDKAGLVTWDEGIVSVSGLEDEAKGAILEVMRTPSQFQELVEGIVDGGEVKTAEGLSTIDHFRYCLMRLPGETGYHVRWETFTDSAKQ